MVTGVFSPPPRYVPSFLSRIGFSLPTFHLFMLVDLRRISPTRALALSACQLLILIIVRNGSLRGSNLRHRPQLLRGLLSNHRRRRYNMGDDTPPLVNFLSDFFQRYTRRGRIPEDPKSSELPYNMQHHTSPLIFPRAEFFQKYTGESAHNQIRGFRKVSTRSFHRRMWADTDEVLLQTTRRLAFPPTTQATVGEGGSHLGPFFFSDSVTRARTPPHPPPIPLRC